MLEGRLWSTTMKRILLVSALLGLVAPHSQAFEKKADARVQQIPARKAESLLNNTLKEGCPVQRKDLRTVRVKYYTDKGKTAEGILVAHHRVASDLLFVFDALYEAKYPIHRIAPASYYDGNDNQLMKRNITSAFNCRRTTDGVAFSNHSLGAAIDINPLWNPYVKGQKVLPPEGKKFAKNRSKSNQPGLIKSDSLVVTLFKDMGWTWGGDWKRLKDYQHFEKKIKIE